MTQTRLLFGLDLDETVVRWVRDSDTGELSWSISEEVQDAIGSALAAGHEVVFVTGRSFDAVADVLQALGVAHGYAAVSNGALIVELNGGRPENVRALTSTEFDPTSIEAELKSRFPGTRLGFVSLAGFSAPDGYIPMWADELEIVHRDGDVLNMFGKVVADDVAVAVQIAAAGGHTVYWDDRRADMWIDIVGPGVSKGSALEWIAKQLGIPRSDTVSIGDGVNDVDMLEWAGTGIAMGNAGPRVKEIADRVTQSVHEDGVARAIESVLSGSGEDQGSGI